MIIEMKGKDVFEVRSYLSLMLAINSELAAPVSLTDRPTKKVGSERMGLNVLGLSNL